MKEAISMKTRQARSVFWAGCVATVGALTPLTATVAQGYPAKSIRIVEGFGAGSASDAAARVIAQKLGDQLGQQVLVDNRTGAGGLIAAETAVKAPPDGYTLLLMAAAHSIHPSILAKMPYAMPRDFVPISLVVTGPFLLVVHPSVPAKNVRELVALTRARPGLMSYSSAGVGSSPHMAAELLNALARVNILHVPYKGSPPALLGVINGEADMSILSITAIQPLLSVGKVRALAVTSAQRTALVPSMPTVHESGVPGYDRSGWYGLLGPAGMPKEVLSKLNATVVQIMKAPEMKTVYFKYGLEPATNSPDEFTAFIQREIDQNIALTRGAGIKLE